MAMKDVKSKSRELNEEELNVVTGGSIVDTVIDAARTVWNIMTSHPKGVKGESIEKDHRTPFD